MVDILPDVQGDVGLRESAAVVIVGSLAMVDVDLTVVTTGLATGEVLADTQAVTNAVRDTDAMCFLESVTLVDADDTGQSLDLLFLSDNVSLGTEGSAPNISDTDALAVVARVPIATTDWTDLGGVRVATVGNLHRMLKPKTGTRDLYVAAVATGTINVQYAGGTMRARLGLTFS